MDALDQVAPALLADTRIRVLNAEEHTHGFVAPDLGMGAFRNAVVLNTVTGREVYPVETSIAFQQFGAPPAPAHDSPTARHQEAR